MGMRTSCIHVKGKEVRTPWTPLEDTAMMASFYDSSPERLHGVTGDKLVDNIEWRIYTEWCCNRDESDFKDHRFYTGHAFNDWVTKETHYTLERAGFNWDRQEGRFDANGTFDQTYRDAKSAVLIAVVRRAVDFFKECEEYKWPWKGDTRNLRAPLEPYIAQRP